MKKANFLIAAALLSLAACGDKNPGSEPTGASTLAAGPEARPGLSLTGGTLILPAVKGNPAAGYFVLTNASDKAVTLAAAFVEGANKAEMHESKGSSMAPLDNLEIKPGDTAIFEPGGKHVMAFDLDPRVVAGGTAEITLTFADGDKISAPLAVKGAGGAAPTAATDDMTEMDHGEMH